MATAATGPVPFKDVDDDGIDFSPRVLSPKEEFADLVASLLRKQLFMDGRLYQLGHSPRCRLIRLLAAFVGRPFTAAEEAAGAVASVIELCSFDRMKGLEVNKRSGTPGGYKSIPRDAFFRKGVNGDCANHMSPETAARLDGIFCDKFRGTGLAIPQPKDMLISYWHFMNRSKFNTMSFSDVWKSIPESTYFGSPIWEHILGYWNASKMNPDRVLFLKYEDVLCDPIKNIERIAEFIGQPFSEAEKKAGIVGSIINLCSLQNLKALDPNNIGFRRVVGIEVPNGSYFRKGKVGDWVNYVTPEMAESLDKFLCDKFHGTGFAFTD
uniref:Sulfotransferase n=1 Tax=Leersia perrieri TaxID=77586 RepID=A0A0D9X1A4_9ORYZ